MLTALLTGILIWTIYLFELYVEATYEDLEKFYIGAGK